MANFGVSHPWVAEYVAHGKYRNSFRCGKAVSTSVNPAYNEASLYGDNQEVENVKEFKNAGVNLGVTELPSIAARIMLGHNVSGDGTEISKTEDSTGYVGYGFITSEMVDGKKTYRSCVLPKVKFAEGEESYETKGDSIVFKTPTLSGTAIGDTDGAWRIKSPQYDTEEEADKWIRVQLGVMEQCAVPVASVTGGTYEEPQSVTLSTSTAGATIRYTTDGTTPSASNGIIYSSVAAPFSAVGSSTAISIASNTGLRAIAYKDGAQDSDIMLEEYFITAN